MPGTSRNIVISTILALVVYLFIFYSETTVFPNIFDQWPGILITVILVNLIGAILLFLNKHYNKWFPWNKFVSVRFVVEVLSGLLLSAVAGSIFMFLYLHRIYDNVDIAFVDFVQDGVIKYAILSLVISYIYSLINFSIYSYNQYSVGQIQALASERMQLGFTFRGT